MSGAIVLDERMRSRIDFSDSCWLWTGNKGKDGYGRFYVGPRSSPSPQRMAHRAVYEAVIGPLSDDDTLHHSCHVRLCVNPDHLLVMTRSEHARLHPDNARTNWERLRARTHCSRGHALTPENTRLKPHYGRTMRTCRVCQRENQLVAQRIYRARKREEKASFLERSE